ncbi:MAG TPA: DNA repair protein RadC [Caldisericia bacterium]|nr:DNA repair protein RadC [Caldisericia bacterium]
MKILDMPNQNRPRERFLKVGPEGLSDAEILAILLRTGSKGENVVDMSNRLIAEYGLDKLMECSLEELEKIKGIGKTKAMQILAIAELEKRINQSKNPVKKITCAKDVFDLMHNELKDKKEEHFYVLMLDTKNKLIGKPVLITKGILDASIVHPREVFRPAIKHSAARIILVHNHPSGNSQPSSEDLDITQRLTAVGGDLGIRVLDHVIVGRGEWWSWMERKKGK